LPTYDFLREYAYGNEEANVSDINQLLSIAGSAIRATTPASPLSPVGRNEKGTTQSYETEFVRVYVNGEIVNAKSIPTYSDPATVSVYVPNKYKYISVRLSVDSVPDFEAEATSNHVQFNNVPLLSSSAFYSIEVEASYSPTEDVIDFSRRIPGVLARPTCKVLGIMTYYVGTTQDRFSLTGHTLDEFTNITNHPNIFGGPNAYFTMTWVKTNLERKVIEDLDSPVTSELTTNYNDVHAFVVIPTNLVTFDEDAVSETIFGTNVSMVRGLHYDIVQMDDDPKYSALYFRDIANMEYTRSRILNVTINPTALL
jgi:hypothetical protein